MTQLTNLVIDPQRNIRKGVAETFQKAHVKAHTRKTKSGKIVSVQEYEDRREKHKEKITHHRQEADKYREMAYAVHDDYKQQDLLHQLANHHEHKFHEHSLALEELEVKQHGEKNAGEKVFGITIPNMKKFSKDDWYGFPGAERFSDGTAPLIGELKVGDEVGLMVVDKGGVGMILESRPDKDVFYDGVGVKEKEILKLARHLQTKKNVTIETLQQLHFENI
jgi:hypothetical protein